MIIFINNQQWNGLLDQLIGINFQLARIADSLEQKFAFTEIKSKTGEIMAQTTYTNKPGTDTFTFTCVDQNGTDITASCTFTATSDGLAVAFGAVSGNTVPLTLTAGTANLTIATTSTTGDVIANVVLAATIEVPATATTTVASATGTIGGTSQSAVKK